MSVRCPPLRAFRAKNWSAFAGGFGKCNLQMHPHTHTHDLTNRHQVCQFASIAFLLSFLDFWTINSSLVSPSLLWNLAAKTPKKGKLPSTTSSTSSSGYTNTSHSRNQKLQEDHWQPSSIHGMEVPVPLLFRVVDTKAHCGKRPSWRRTSNKKLPKKITASLAPHLAAMGNEPFLLGREHIFRVQTL